jgi:hypothetical protein
MKRSMLALCLAIVVSTALGQFNTPTIDGVVNAGEYGVHINGQTGGKP